MTYSYRRQYRPRQASKTEGERTPWNITCIDCGVFVIKSFDSSVTHHFKIRCVECNLKLLERLANCEKELKEYSEVQISRVIDSKGKDVYKKPELSETSTV